MEKIQQLKQGSVAGIIGQRMREFRQNFEDEEKIFSELCFCIVTANNRADVGLRMQEELNSGLEGAAEGELAKTLLTLGSRFYRNKAKYLVEAKGSRVEVLQTLREEKNEFALREWLVKNVKGLGYKEASHFLRNISYRNLAILDRHILRAMQKNKLIKKIPEALTRKRYLRLEKKLAKLAEASGVTQGELDLYLWFMETGKVLK